MEHSYGSWSLKGEKAQGREILAMKIISLESNFVSNYFSPSMHMFHRSKRLIFT